MSEAAYSLPRKCSRFHLIGIEPFHHSGKASLAELVERQSGGKKVGLEEFRFLKVLGKGSFGKVSLNAGSTSTDGVSETYMLERNTVNKILPFIKEQMCELATAITTATLLVSGDARGEEGYRGGVRDQGPEEGRDRAGRRRRVHHDREEDPRPRRQPPLPHITPLLFPNKGQSVSACKTDSFIFYLAMTKDDRTVELLLSGPSLLRDGVRERRRSHVPNPAGAQVRRDARTILLRRSHARTPVPPQTRRHLQASLFDDGLFKIHDSKPLR